ncbi:hypothetical protein WA577_002379 [Blastocystis sp. JDR]
MGLLLLFCFVLAGALAGIGDPSLRNSSLVSDNQSIPRSLTALNVTLCGFYSSDCQYRKGYKRSSYRIAGTRYAQPSSIVQVEEEFASSSCSEHDLNAVYRLLYTIAEVDGFFVRVQLDRVLFTFYPSYVIQSRCQIDPKKEYDVTAVSCRAFRLATLQKSIGTSSWLYIMEGSKIPVDDYFCKRQGDDGCVDEKKEDDNDTHTNLIVVIVVVIVVIVAIIGLIALCMNC